MTIQELLVKDGEWPNIHGPKGYTPKPQYPWITCNSWAGILDTKTSAFPHGLVLNNHMTFIRGGE